MQRTGRWYRRNEREVMEAFGLRPVLGSGSGWVQKEDGESEAVLCQLKSTDKESLRLQQIDLERLELHAATAHKLPLFVVEFLATQRKYFVVSPSVLQDLAALLPKVQNTDGEPVEKEQECKAREAAPSVCPDAVAARERLERERRLLYNARQAEHRREWREKVKSWKLNKKSRL